MARAGQEIESPGGMKLRFVRTGAEAGGELPEMEAAYSGDGSMPPMHLHPRQAERFVIVEGRIRAIVDGEESVYEEGAAFEVPAGAPHQMGAERPTRMRWEVRPALRTAEFVERLYGSGPDCARELGERFFAEFADEFQLTARSERTLGARCGCHKPRRRSRRDRQGPHARDTVEDGRQYPLHSGVPRLRLRGTHKPADLSHGGNASKGGNLSAPRRDPGAAQAALGLPLTRTL